MTYGDRSFGETRRFINHIVSIFIELAQQRVKEMKGAAVEVQSALHIGIDDADIDHWGNVRVIAWTFVANVGLQVKIGGKI